ncbi:AAA family ATPase [Microcystis aeruginosa NIES-298]|jgi:predicted ATP-binding protein involved in virulence|uniref:Excinuclease ATPase subunit n=3 Tax=Microcystis TaxID=1125 RepID=A0A2H6BW15_MICAE|nr:AAA family ATPase [Microcystis aeruginosa]REJ41109.1 MAG: excinuclease [Microcystis flos-aquae TF09]ELP55851.1 AAA ATPase [Microcystis aeruginosa TAIHU98]QHU84259.1 AAA family ATPase [Microcystis aeruginosa NIES-298]WOB68456.1 AAA family ATPase [Microcystis aeruginosa LE3]GBD54383.1 putative excinuclease ATPase subunit [Microcystis aeruginosa NIES-298]
MRIKQITVKHLFGIFDHTINLNMEERITIIHGKNGFGKTSILRLVNGFFNLKYSDIRAIPFQKFTIIFDDKSFVDILKPSTSRNKKSNGRPKITFNFTSSDQKEEPTFSPDSPDGKTISFPLGMIDDFIPDLDRVGSEKWLYTPTKEILYLEDIYERFGEYLPKQFQKEYPDWLKKIRDSINVRFIESQRLLDISNSAKIGRTIRRPMTLYSVASYSEDLAENIQTKLAEYGQLSQTLDRTFPARVVQKKASLTDDQLREKIDQLERERNQLISAGLLKKDEDSNFQVRDSIDDSTRKLLSVYIEDVETKLNVFNDIYPKVELFKNIINKKYSFKSVTIDQSKGFIFTTQEGEVLSPTDLSSGEQHELVILYELLFKVKPNTLILIDEPEMSLHISWQQEFLKDLQEITKLSELDILMATHSPDIINDRWDLTVELEKPKQKSKDERTDNT